MIKKLIILLLFPVAVLAQDKMLTLPEGSTVPEWVPLGSARAWEFNVVDYGAIGNGVADDTDAFQDAIDAAVAYDGGVLVIPQASVNWTITSTLTVDRVGNDTTRMDLYHVGGDHNDISYEGSNNTALFTVTGLYNSHWEGLTATILNGRSGCVLIDIYGPSQYNTFKNMSLRLGGNDEGGTAAARNEDCIGIRMGLTGSQIMGNYSFENVMIRGGNDDTPASSILGQYGYLMLSSNNRNNNYLGGLVWWCEKAWTNINRAGDDRGDGMQYFYGFSGTDNGTDFTFTIEGNYIISGGKFRSGDKFLVTSSTSSLIHLMIENVNVREYSDDDDQVLIQTPSAIVIDNALFVKSASATYASVISLNSTGNVGSLTIKNSSFSLTSGTTYPYIIAGTTTWQITLDNNMRQKATASFLQTDTHFPNSKTSNASMENITPLLTMNNGATGVSELRWAEDSDNGSNYVGLTVNSTLAGNTTYTLPTAYPAVSGYVLTSTTAGVMSWAVDATGGGGGITNGAANNELMKSDGTNAVASGLGSSAAGDLNFGLSGTTGTTRTATATGSSTNIGLTMTSKGSGDLTLATGLGGMVYIGGSSSRLKWDATNGRFGHETDGFNLYGNNQVVAISSASLFQVNDGTGIVLPITGTALSSNTTLDDTYYTVLVNATSGSKTITLPAVNIRSGRIYTIKKSDSTGNTVVIDANASELIDGATTRTLSTQYQGVTIQTDGTQWRVISVF